ncbi:hypothetical protein Ataiwa_13910 [Algoriphagus taiwanensis]|uniref:Uncharacterized protein n=1 Tax=Algoriphagus taiwanensis TaxID=1445656 RepID=A0ABQ6PYX0_9BACT|nr:hypothetical protein Ataiwa_13910 [Algoriphagus taiwanensis]
MALNSLEGFFFYFSTEKRYSMFWVYFSPGFKIGLGKLS